MSKLPEHHGFASSYPYMPYNMQPYHTPVVLGQGFGGPAPNYYGPVPVLHPMMGGAPNDAVLYDETSNQPVMYERRQELVEQGHSVVPLSVAYRIRLASLQAEINGPLLQRRDSLLRRVTTIQVRADEVRAVRSALEREAQALYESMLDKLRTTEALKMTMLQREREEAARGLEEIQSFIGEATAASQAQDLLEFLQQFPSILDRCKRMAGRPMSDKVEVSAQDFENEAHVYADLSNRFGALQKLISLKDAMIWELLEIRTKLQHEAVESQDKAAQRTAELQAENDALRRRVADLEAAAPQRAQGQAQGQAPARTEVDESGYRDA